MADSDFELLDAWRNGDQQAGKELFGRHFEALYRFFRSKVGDEADDLIQQTFLACVRARDGFRGDSSFRTYLYTAARSKLYNHYAARGKAAGKSEEQVSLSRVGETMGGALLQREEQRLLLHGLRALPIDLQIALELHYFEGMRGPQIAEILDIPEGTVRSRLRLGRKRLREALESLEGQHVRSTLTKIEDWAMQIRAKLEDES